MDVVVVGSCMTDLISYAPRLPKRGETLHGSRFNIGFGGKGANQCVVASRLGALTSMVAKVGSDTFGNNYIRNFEDNNVSIANVLITDTASTGAAQIIVDEEGSNVIVIVAGANLLLSEEDVHAAENVIKCAKVLVCQLEIKPETTLAAIKLAKKHGVISILNPAPATENLKPELYTLCDIFCPNETEAELLLGQPVTSVDEAKSALQTLLQKGCNSVIITLGEKGCLFGSQSEPVIHISAQSVKPVDSTGAGDAFVGALAFYLSKICFQNLPMKEKLQRACNIATISVQKEGTQTSYPWKEDLPKELFD